MSRWMEILLRSIGLFFFVFIMIRLMGKRQPVKMTPFKFITYAVIAVLAALISAGIIQNLVLGLIGLSVWILIPIIIDYLALKSKWVHDLINGKETILIKNGKVMEENLKQTRFTAEDLLKELRSKNAFNIADVEFAVMETTGEVNLILKSEKMPVTPFDLGKSAPITGEPQTVILDGNVLWEPLSNLGLNQSWLTAQLEGMGVTLDNVFIGQVNASGDLFLDLFDDSIQIPQPKVREMLFANLEKSQADFLKYSLETKNRNAKNMYSTSAEKLQKLINQLQPYLLR
jgi:uncharacterized membrane protein YcaP (DUF421 family)